MPDSKQRIPRVMSDTDRALEGKRARTSPGIPEHVDHELTPPPQAPELRPTMSIERRIDLIGDAVGGLTEALGKVWNERGNAGRIEALERAVAGYTVQVARQQETLDSLVVPSIKSLLPAVESLRLGAERSAVQLEQFFERDWPKHEALMERLTKTLDDIAGRTRTLEGEVITLRKDEREMAARLADVEKKTAEIERLTRERDAVALAVTSTNRRWMSWGKAGLVGVGAVVAWIVSHVGEIAAWVRK